jgi:ppGpp synthetase/RelA/SpoT-type nucleotidyltranferase
MSIDTDPEFIQAVKDEQARILERIEGYQVRIKEASASLLTVADRLRPKHELLAKLREAGFNPSLSWWSEEIVLEVRQKDLTKVYRVTGRLKKEYHNLHNARKRQVEITLVGVHHPFVKVKYIRKLSQGDPCKVVRHRTRASTTYCLECQVPTTSVS